MAELELTGDRSKGGEPDLQRLLAAEPARWTAFNARIEQLERSAAAASR